MELSALKNALFERGAAVGFTDMELYYQSSEKFSANVFKGDLDKFTQAVDGGISFRGRLNGKMGYAYTEKIDESAIDLLLNAAQNSAGVIDSEEVEPLYAGPFDYQPLELFAADFARVTPAEKIAFLKELDAECYRLDSRISLVNHCSCSTEISTRYIANTKGLEVSERSNIGFAVVGVVARKDNDTKTAYEFTIGKEFKAFNAKALAAKVVAEAVSYLGAEPVESRTYPVLLRKDAASDLLSTYVGVFFAENAQKGKSRLKGKVGQAIAGANITLVDDPLRADGAASRSFDSEGTPTRKLSVVEKGVLKSLLYNQKTGGIDGVPSTGHGTKQSYKSAVVTAPSNFYLEPGTRSFDELVKSMAEGVIITSLQGLHSGANPISGDFSLLAGGYYVKNGEIAHPVNQITVAGNFYDVMNSVAELGSDLEFYPGHGNIGTPSLLIKGLAITGK
ncbi:MAG: TldD/PmbA family protein [Mycobacterium leprae]